MLFDGNKQTQLPLALDDVGNTLDRQSVFSISDKFPKARGLIFHLCKNTLGSLAGYLGCLRNRIVPLMLDAGMERGLLGGLLAIYRPNYLWVPASRYDIDLGTKILEQYDYVLVEHCKEPAVLSDDLALLLTTSGSTGSPKLVRLSYNNIQSNAEAIAEYLEITPEERPVTSLPMSYSFGLSVINSHLLKGATILLTDGAVTQKEFWNFAKEQKATSLSGVPYTYEMLRRLRIFRMDLPSLKTFTQAGGKLSAALVKEYVEQATVAGKRFIVMYGQTEATARMSYLPFERALEKYSSIGIPIPGGRFALADENGSTITEPDKDGELVYYGANVSLGYAESREDLAKGDENKGVLHTGDIARRDSDGFYTITGRKKRFVKVFGNRVNLDAVEQIVKAISTSCACVGVDDKITIFITEPDTNKDSEIKSLLSQKTGLNTRAFSVQHLDKIPKNASGKVQYSVLSEQIEK
ncbi:MAG: AMP-dependent synthetase [Clostridia bacterium]|nr:AMP-dependent synthetase [Clostridia bacterium]